MERTGDDPRRLVGERLLASHGKLLTSLADVGRAIAQPWDGEAEFSAANVRDPLAEALQQRGLNPALLDALDTGASALDAEIQGSPVPAPPYLVVTSRGPICRATLDDGRRLVVAFVLFRVERRPRRYLFLDPTPAELPEIRLV